MGDVSETPVREIAEALARLNEVLAGMESIQIVEAALEVIPDRGRTARFEWDGRRMVYLGGDPMPLCSWCVEQRPLPMRGARSCSECKPLVRRAYDKWKSRTGLERMPSDSELRSEADA